MFQSILDFLKNNQTRIFDFLMGFSIGLIILLIERIFNKKDKEKDAKEQQKIFCNEKINKIIDEKLKTVNPLLKDFCKVAITQNMKPNWWIDNICLSKMKVDLANAILSNSYSHGCMASAKGVADKIINNIVSKIKKRL